MARKTVKHEIVNEEKWDQVKEKNKELLEEFVEYLESIDRSHLTIINYESDIKICFIWCLENAKNKLFVDFTKRDFMKYQNYLLNKLELSSNRIRRMRSALSSMGNFIENIMDDEYPDYRNIVNKIPAPVKTAVRKKTVLSDEQAQSLLDNLVDNKEYQKACAFSLAWASGSRKSELLRFKRSYFKDEYIIFGSLYKTPEKIKTKGHGKQGKLLEKYTLVSKFKPYFEMWMKQREELGVPNELDDIFVTKQKGEWKPMKLSTLNSWTRQFSKFLNEDFYFHCLRHNFTTGLSASGIPAEIIKGLVGWSSVEMVSIYDDQEVDDKLGDYFGEDGIKQVEKKGLSDL